MTRPRVVLIGPMGVGKTTVGRLLAEQWGVDLQDTDDVVQERAGMTVQELFVTAGEAHFRALERDVVAEALDPETGHDGVLALGGGAPLDAETQERMAGHRVVFLQVGLADAAKRVGLGQGRPLLLGNVRSRVKQLLEERAPLYERLATIVVDTDGRSAEDVAADIRTRLEEQQ